jgi:hypothetical protein
MSLAATPASATSGPGCFGVVNVPNWDVLNIRALTSASSAIVGRIPPEGHGIIAQEGRCLPLSRSLPQRWCQIAYYDGGRTVYGFVKRRFLRPGECP